jgi:hypothetical protein
MPFDLKSAAASGPAIVLMKAAAVVRFCERAQGLAA